eukprot:350807-Chlamydomonas_euryale.AAC.3
MRARWRDVTWPGAGGTGGGRADADTAAPPSGTGTLMGLGLTSQRLNMRSICGRGCGRCGGCGEGRGEVRVKREGRGGERASRT